MVNGAQTKLLSAATEDMLLTLQKAQEKLNIADGVVPELNECFNLMLPPTFVMQLMTAINRAFVKEPLKKVTTKDIGTFFTIMLLLHRHRCSPTELFRELKHADKSQFGIHPELVEADEDLFKRVLS